MSRKTGKLADPAWRAERAHKAATARTTIDAHITAIEKAIDAAAERDVNAAPPLTQSQRHRLALLLHPGEPNGAGT
jgi:hypothetical protein